LVPLLIPFAKACQEGRPDILVMEDGAPAYRSIYQEEVFIRENIKRLR